MSRQPDESGNSRENKASVSAAKMAALPGAEPLVAYNGVQIPAFMYGTAWKENDTARLVELAVEVGFQAIDTANQLIHYKEALVGDALLALYKKGLRRESLFLQTKFTPKHGQDNRTPYDLTANLTTQVKQSMDSSLVHLHTDAVDSYVLHGPHSRSGLLPEDWEVWAAIEDLYDTGKTKMIGVSNVNAGQLDELCNNARYKPMLVQNRCYAVTGWDGDVRKICRKLGIIYQGFSLLTANSRALSAQAIQNIATRLNATIPQLVFRFSMQIGMLPLTGTTSEKHMKEDLQSYGIELTPEDLQTIESIEN